MTEFSGAIAHLLLLLTVCPLLGGLPLIDWIARVFAGKRLSQVGTGNVSVSAAFRQAGVGVGILAALSEAGKGIAAVLLARVLFPDAPGWELIALIALVLGRYGFTGGSGTTNATWGLAVHDPVTTGLAAVLAGLGFGIVRDRRIGRTIPLVLFPIILAVRHPGQWLRIGSAIALGSLLAWLYERVPDDLAPAENLLTLDRPLDPSQVGQKAATLSELKRAGYPVAVGWVLPKGEDSAPILEILQPSPDDPLIVRSSAVGEDIAAASAAGQYETVANVTNTDELADAIAQCIESYDRPEAVQYRLERGIESQAMSVLIQQQIKGKFSGVAFSRDPVTQQADAVLVEGLPGGAAQVVSGEATPEDYRVVIRESDLAAIAQHPPEPLWQLPENIELELVGQGELPTRLVQQVAFLARQIERHYHGIPQDIEWTYDGEKLWLLQARPITNLLPIWTRKIASEVIPGTICPLVWSINRPLTCQVWGEIFTVVLQDRASGLDFEQTATLHYSHAYFNASLLGEIFQRMGLPAESLEFLTLGESFTPPSPGTTLQNLPGLLRLLGRELSLEQDFQRDRQDSFIPTLEYLTQESPEELSPPELLERIEVILAALRRATYYNILVPLSVSVRQAVLRVDEEELDRSSTPEIAALRSLQRLASKARPLVENDLDSPWQRLSQTPQGQDILEQFEQIIERYGYLSEVATDFSVPTWKDDPTPVRSLFVQFLKQLPPEPTPLKQRLNAKLMQSRVNLRAQVAIVYNQFMAHLRWGFLALAGQWQAAGMLSQSEDIFFLEWPEIQSIIFGEEPAERSKRIELRRENWQRDRQLRQVPALVYGNQPPPASSIRPQVSTERLLRGIGASAGQVQGQVRVIRDWRSLPEIDRSMILVVPYTDAGWASILAQAGGLISEVGGRLSHGAIIAREYQIPAVMNIANATEQLQDGQQVRIDGQRGIVEVLESARSHS